MDKISVGSKLRSLRMERGESIEITAGKIGISKSALAMYERGERTPRDEVKVKISKYYEKGIEEIFLQVNYTYSAITEG